MYIMDKPWKVLIASSGSVASLKVPLLLQHLVDKQCEVRIVVTDKALHFLEAEMSLPEGIKVLSDNDEWLSWTKRGDPVMHIELMRWADIFVLAPISANTLAKVANGQCDNLVTCVARAWPLQSKPAIFCPAMNTHMWEHPITAKQIETLKTWGYKEVPCIAKTLICGDTGLGAMAEVQTIIDTILQTVTLSS